MEDAGMLTLLFLCVLTLLGKWLFRVEDWGERKKPRKPVKTHSGIVHGKYLPPAYLKGRPTGKVDMQAYRDFHTRHDVVSDGEFQDMIDRS